MPTIEHISNSLTEQQCELLNWVWLYRLEKKEWPAIRIIEHSIDTEHIVTRDLAQSLGGSIIYETQENNQLRYALTLLGVLLSIYRDEAEELLIQYLEYVRKKYSENPETERITSVELEQNFRLTSDISACLRELVSIGHIWGGSASLGSTGEWSAGLPSDVNRLRFEKDLRQYIRQRALERYVKEEPTEMTERYKSFFEDQMAARLSFEQEVEQPQESSLELGFDFINNASLKEFMSRDWHEVQKALRAEAWKSCIVLCGSILEAMLLDVVTCAGNNLKTPANQNIPNNPSNWKLIHLIAVARENRFLSGPTASFAGGLRDFRNLVHIDRQVRENVIADQYASNLAVQVVALVHRELINRLRK